MHDKKVKEKNKKFFDFWASFYDCNWTLIKPWLFYIQKRIINNLNIRNDAKLLDIGCGTGDALFLISKKTSAKLYGVDISEKMIEKAIKKLREKAILKLSDAENLPFNDNTFDYVLSTEAFHHFPNPNKTLKEINRVLKKNGEFMLADVNFYSDFIHWLFKKVEPGHVKIYSKDEFKELFINNSFKIIAQKRLGIFAILTIGKKLN